MSKKIIVIDDDTQQRELYVDVFKKKGFEVLSAQDGLEGLDLTLKVKPDLVFTGIIMPRMDGFEMIKNLRANVATAQIPIVMFSHLGRMEDRDKAKSLNVTFMVKGVDGPALIAKTVDEMINAPVKDPQ